MYVCSKCKYTHSSAINFCPICGGTMAPEAPVSAPAYSASYAAPAAPTYSASYTTPAAPTYSASYTTPAAPAATPKSRIVKRSVGLGLAIGGLFFAILIAIVVLSSIDSRYYVRETAFGLAVVYAIFSLPLSIVGLALSGSARNAGDTSPVSLLGKIFGIVAAATTGLFLFISIVNIA